MWVYCFVCLYELVSRQTKLFLYQFEKQYCLHFHCLFEGVFSFRIHTIIIVAKHSRRVVYYTLYIFKQVAVYEQRTNLFNIYIDTLKKTVLHIIPSRDLCPLCHQSFVANGVIIVVFGYYLCSRQYKNIVISMKLYCGLVNYSRFILLLFDEQQKS